MTRATLVAVVCGAAMIAAAPAARWVVGGQPTTAALRLNGYVGGPYKVLVADFTGDGRRDVLLGVRNLGRIQVIPGGRRGQLDAPSTNLVTNLSGQRRDRATDPGCWSPPHVHNLHAADFNGDGRLDVVASLGGASLVKPGRVVVARGELNGRFRPVVEFLLPSEAKGVHWADLDRDGRLDLLYTARGSGYMQDLHMGELHMRRGLPDELFGPAVVLPAGRSAYAIDTGDLDADGFLDVVIPNEHDETVTICLSPGRRCLEARPGGGRRWRVRAERARKIPGRRSHAINDARLADLDGDSRLDIVTANLGTSTLSVFRGRGDGTFDADRQYEAGKNGAFLGLGDLDNDGDVDIVITHWTEAFVSVFLNNGDGTLAPRTDLTSGLGSYGVDVADLDGDGRLDIVSANYRDATISVFRGRGDGRFGASETTARGLRVTGGRLYRAP